MSKMFLRYSLVPIMVMLVVSSAFFFVTPKKSEAGVSECIAGVAGALGAGAVASRLVSVPVADTPNTAVNSGGLVKECLLDGLAVSLRETLIRKVTNSIVTWINSGFEGSPAFVQDIDQFLLDTADETFGEFIYNDENFGFLCEPFQFNVRFALALSYASRTQRPSCTLSEVTDNVETAIDDLSDQWSWDTFNVVMTSGSGNYFSSYITASEDLDRLIQKTTGQSVDDLNRSGGFLSYEECELRNIPGESFDSDTRNVTRLDEEGNLVTDTTSVIGGGDRDRTYRNSDNETCVIKTPGSVINEQLNNTFSSDIRRLELADELDEIFSALMGQLVKQIIGGGGGITGLSRANAGSRSFIEQYANDRGNGQQTTNDVSRLVTNYVSNAESVVEAEERRIELLSSASTTVADAFACYDEKYNTWVDSDGDVIADDEVEDVAIENPSRATFFAGRYGGPGNIGDDFRLLTPTQSEQKRNRYEQLLSQIATDVDTAEQRIENLQSVIADASEYADALATANSANETNQIYAQFSSQIAGTGISTSLTTATPIETVEAEVEQILQGPITGYDPNTGMAIRAGGVTADLQECQAFVNVYRGSDQAGNTQ